MQNETLSQTQSELSLKEQELKNQQASHQKLIDIHRSLKMEQLDNQKV